MWWPLGGLTGLSSAQGCESKAVAVTLVAYLGEWLALQSVTPLHSFFLARW